MTEETPGGWAKRDWFPTNHFRWNMNRKQNIPGSFNRWLNGTFTTTGYRLEQLWELRTEGQPVTAKEWRRIGIALDGYDESRATCVYKEGEP